MATKIARNNETFIAIAKYLKDSVGIEARDIEYRGTHSNEGLTPIVHYAIGYNGTSKEWPFTQYRIIHATVYWNNDVPHNQIPQITRMDVTTPQEGE